MPVITCVVICKMAFFHLHSGRPLSRRRQPERFGAAASKFMGAAAAAFYSARHGASKLNAIRHS